MLFIYFTEKKNIVNVITSVTKTMYSSTVLETTLNSIIIKIVIINISVSPTFRKKIYIRTSKHKLPAMLWSGDAMEPSRVD